MESLYNHVRCPVLIQYVAGNIVAMFFKKRSMTKKVVFCCREKTDN